MQVTKKCLMHKFLNLGKFSKVYTWTKFKYILLYLTIRIKQFLVLLLQCLLLSKTGICKRQYTTFISI